MMMQSLEKMSVEELARHPVWRMVFDDDLDDDQVFVTPVERLPVRTLSNKLVVTNVVLSNGESRLAMLGNIDPENARKTRHFLMASLYDQGRWFHLARYHDSNVSTSGPHALAAFLRLPMKAVFPISYDIRAFVRGDPEALAGTIPAEPEERLSRERIIALAVPKVQPPSR